MSTLSDVFRELNILKEQRAIEEYAIAGAMAFLFYTEPVRTYDLDVFVFLPPQSSFIFSMEPLYSVLRNRGFTFDAEHAMIYDTPVQFLPAYNPLVEEAVREAIIHDYDGVPVRVVGPEHLAALALQTGGRHRRMRAEALIEDGALDREKLAVIMSVHGIKQG